MFRGFRTEVYNERILKLSKDEQLRVADIERQVSANPHTGKPLGYEFFREKKFGGKRVLFLVYDDLEAVFFVAITDKKDQQEYVQMIRERLDRYSEEIRRLLRNP